MHGHPDNYLVLVSLDLREVSAWLEEEFGPEGERWVFIRPLGHDLTQPPHLAYIFEDEDAIAAKLRWA